MAQADGSIIIDTGFNLDGMEAGSKEIEQAARRMAQSVGNIGKKAEISLQKQINSFSKANAAYAQQEKKIQDLVSELNELENIRIPTEEYNALYKELQKATKEANKMAEQTPKLDALGLEIDKLAQAANDYAREVDYIAVQKIPTREYTKLQSQLESVSRKYEELNELVKTLDKLGSEENSLHLKKARAEAQDLYIKMNDIKDAMSDLEESGKSFTLGKDTKQYDAAYDKFEKTYDKLNEKADTYNEMVRKREAAFAKEEEMIIKINQLIESGKSSTPIDTSSIEQKLAVEKEKLAQMNRGLATSYESLREKVSSYTKESSLNFLPALKNIFQSLKKISKQILKIGFGSVVNGLKKISSGILSIHKSANKTTFSLGKMLKYTFGIRSLFVLFNKMCSAIVSGFGNLAQYSEETNAAISSLKSSITQLKNSFATAFAPILTTVDPILTTFINMISRAVTYVGMLIAALTGQDTFTKAVEVQEDYAASLDKTSSSANKAEKALKRYLSPLDEINRYEADNNSGIGSGSGNNYTGPSPYDMFETVPIENSIKGIADKIKTLVESEDWAGLGGYIAGGINKGLQKVYKLISWDNVGPKVRGFVIPFTTTFNSIVDLMDWDRLGRTVGAGVKTITRSVNMLADNIDWVNLGSKISTGFKGLLDEVDWNDFGHLIGQKFKIAWDLFYGFVKDPELFGKIGKAVADGFTGLTDTIPFGEIGLAFAYGINDAFDFLAIFARTFPWDTFANNVKNGITNFLEKTNWSENGEKLGNFILHLAETLRMMLDKDTFYKFGNAVGEFLGALPWDEILKEAAGFMIDALVGLFSGLKDSGNAGKIASYLGEMFLAVKVANITGISKLVTLLIKRIVKNFGLSSNTKQVSDAIENTIGKGIKDAASNLDGLSKAAGKTAEGVSGISSALNTLALGAGIVGTIELTKNLAGMADAARGGNGYLTELGGGIEGLTEKLKLSKGITKEQSDELFLLKESLEDANASPEEFASAFVDAFGKMGISSEDARLALLNLGSQVTLSADQAKMLELIVSGLGDSTQTMASKINLAGIDSEEAYGKMYSALDMLYGQAKITDTQLSYLQTQFALQYPAVQSAQEGYELLSDLLQSQGVDAATTAQIIGELFPEAVKTAEKSTTESMKNIDKASGEAMEATESHVTNASNNISKGVSNSMALSQKSVEDATGEIAKTTQDEWSNSQDSVTTNLSGIEKSTKETMRDVAAVVRTYWDSVQINTNRVWTEMGEKILGTMRTVIIKVNSMIRNINASIGGVERAFTFSYDVKNPLTGVRSYGNYWMNLPRVSTIPYLATGAVIPPNREFMAVLGDQKHGKNIEAPESLLRQIVREESGGSENQGNATLRFQAVLNRRIIFDEMIKEAELRQQSSGLNPFELL